LPTPFTKARQPCKAGRKFRLKDFDPGGTGKATSEDKPRAKELLETGIQALAGLQDVLYAQERKSQKRQMFM
jgi:hypothetical protein